MIIDIHSHVLPEIDDGSRSVQVSAEMLMLSKKQGVDIIAATPHFYAWDVSLDSFLEKRSEAYLSVKEHIQKENLTEKVPEIVLGAETAFFDGIGSSEALKHLTYEGTDILLLEMPFKPWTAQQIMELEKIRKRGYRILFAHIERYFSVSENKKFIRGFLEGPDLVQVNAECFQGFLSKHRFLPLIQKGCITFMGSDAHGMHRRPPDLPDGRRVLSEKLGPDFLESFDRRQEEILAGVKIYHF